MGTLHWQRIFPLCFERNVYIDVENHGAVVDDGLGDQRQEYRDGIVHCITETISEQKGPSSLTCV